MTTENLIPLETLCENYSVEFSFIDSLSEIGLIRIVTVEQKRFIDKEQISDVEKIMRLHYDLGINLEGIDVIAQLLRRIAELQLEVKTLKGRAGEGVE
jgi:hypothetical protein